MKKIKFLSAILCILFVAGAVLTGCSIASTGAASTPPAATTAAASATEAAATAAAATEAANDTPVWRQPFANTVSLTGVVGWTEDTSVKKGTTPETNSFLTICKNMLNVDIKILWSVPSDQFQEKFNLSISSGEIPDLLMLNTTQFYDFMNNGELMDVTDAYNNSSSDELKSCTAAFSKEALDYSSIDGKLYAIPSVLNTTESIMMLAYRQDWLDALGMKAPTTAEEMNKMFIAFSKYGKNYSGSVKTTGLATVGTIFDGSFGLTGYFQSYGAYPLSWVLKDGALVNGTIQPEMKVALDNLKALYAAGGLDTDFATLNSDQLGTAVTNDTVGAVFGGYWIPAWPLYLNMTTNPKADWKMMALVGSNGAQAKSMIPQSPIQFYNCVSAKASPDAAAALAKLLSVYISTSQWSKDDKSIYNGLDKPENGFGNFYSPVFLYYPSPWASCQQDVWDAYKTGDESKLASNTEKNFFASYKDWMDNKTNSKTFAQNWGTYESRLVPDGGIGLAMAQKAAGNYVENIFYGAPTSTELKVSSTLQDTAMKFCTDYIMGNKSDSDWDAFVKEWLNLGGQAWTDEVNAQYQKLNNK